jgi:hypothetical protein
MVGPSVNLAARLMGKAKPWQVLVEETVRENVRAADSSWSFSGETKVKAKGYDHDVSVYVPDQEESRHITHESSLVDEFTQLWGKMELRVQMVGKVAAVLSNGPDGLVDFPFAGLASIVHTLDIASYSELKDTMAKLQATKFFRLRRGSKRASPDYAFAVEEVHQWVLGLCTKDYAAQVNELFAKWRERVPQKRAGTVALEQVDTTASEN